jgi:AcrR family transcriptional regulator
MLTAGQPKFKRRKANRPDEIVAAALEVFSEKGFAAARLEDIAAQAGVSKGAIYLYFATKQDIFRAVVEQGVAPNLDVLRAGLAAPTEDFAELLRGLVKGLAGVVASTSIGGIVKMVIGESRNFPELAQAWHDQLVHPALGAMTNAIAAAQARGELRPGDPRQYAISLISPMLVGVIWRETFTPVGADPIDIPSLAEQHVDLWLRGLMAKGGAAS